MNFILNFAAAVILHSASYNGTTAVNGNVIAGPYVTWNYNGHTLTITTQRIFGSGFEDSMPPGEAVQAAQH